MCTYVENIREWMKWNWHRDTEICSFASLLNIRLVMVFFAQNICVWALWGKKKFKESPSPISSCLQSLRPSNIKYNLADEAAATCLSEVACSSCNSTVTISPSTWQCPRCLLRSINVLKKFYIYSCQLALSYSDWLWFIVANWPYLTQTGCVALAKGQFSFSSWSNVFKAIKDHCRHNHSW